jgi:serine/threonine-protein kinase
VGCLQESTVLDFAEARLPPDSRGQVEAHSQACSSCHALLSAAMNLAASERTAATIRLGRACAAGAAISEKPVRPGAAFGVPRMPLRPGTTIDRYTILKLVGRGGMGEVYAAFDSRLDRRVALKILHAEGAARDRHAQDRLLREAQAIAKLSHPNVVVVHDVGIFDSRVFVAMEFVEGQTLAMWLIERPRTWQKILATFIQAAHGLSAAHAAGLVHRDFKPQNVMVAKDGTVRVTDFGLAQRVDDPEGAPGPDAEDRSSADASLTQTGELAGTPLYMAPEQFDDGYIDGRTDQFSFCVALYWALFRAHPFGSSSHEQGVSLELPLRRRRGPPYWVQRALLRGLSRDPAARWGSMNELERALAHEPTIRYRNVAAIAAVIALTCIAVGIGGVRLSAQRRRLCTEGPSRLAGIWEPGGGVRRDGVRTAIFRAGRDEAPRIWDRVAALLDRHTTDWLAAYRDSCEATNVRSEQSWEDLDLRTQCLNDDLDATRALTDVLVRGDASAVEHAVEAASALGGVQRCWHVEQLRLGPRLPSDPSVRRRVEELRARLRDADQLYQLEDNLRAREITRGVLAQANELHYCPLQAEAMVFEGSAEASMNPELAQGLLDRALEYAESCGHDLMVARAAIELVWAHGLRHPELAERAASLARGALTRLGGDARLESWLANNVSTVLFVQGRFADAQSEIERAIELKSRTVGSEHLDTAFSLDNEAQSLLRLGRTREALEVVDRALAIEALWVGVRSDHYLSAASSRADILLKIGKYAEAEAELRRLIATPTAYEINIGRECRSLGQAVTHLGRPLEAIPLLKRALRVQGTVDSPFEIADSKFALAEAREAASPRDPKALALAREAAATYSTTVYFPEERAQITSWLAAHQSVRSR